MSVSERGIDPETKALLMQLACFSADEVAIGFQGTQAARTAAVIERAIEALVANGVITVTPREQWGLLYAPYPPYTLFGENS